MADKFWDSEVLVAKIEKKREGESIQIRQCENKSGKFVDVRQFYQNVAGKDIPTAKGICIPVDNVAAIALVLANLTGMVMVPKPEVE